MFSGSELGQPSNYPRDCTKPYFRAKNLAPHIFIGIDISIAQSYHGDNWGTAGTPHAVDGRSVHSFPISWWWTINQLQVSSNLCQLRMFVHPQWTTGPKPTAFLSLSPLDRKEGWFSQKELEFCPHGVILQGGVS